VRARRRGPGDRLHVDVANIGERDAFVGKRLIERVQSDAGLNPNEPRVGIQGQDAIHSLEREEEPVGRHRVGERVPRPGNPHRPAPIGSPGDRRRDLLRCDGPLERSRRARLVAGPVPPREGGLGHGGPGRASTQRKQRPSPRYVGTSSTSRSPSMR
jgi:hypothetical protein